MRYKLRPYQQKAVNDAMQCLEGHKNGIIVMPTGSGKSLIIASIAQLAGGKTIILQPTKEILEQNKAKMESFGIYNIGVYSASCSRKDIGQITFATIGSVIHCKELFQPFDRIVVDECHLVNSKRGMYENFINHLQFQVLGLTATPYRMKSYRNSLFGNGEYVAESRILTRTRPRIFNKIIHITQVKNLFEQGYLCPLNYEWDNDYDSKKVKSTSTGQGFDDVSLKLYNKEQDIPAKIVDVIRGSKSKHILIFTKFRSESEVVIDKLRQYGIQCTEVSAETPKRIRSKIIRGFKWGTIRCVVNVGVLTTGFDFPELDEIVLGRPTKSVALYYQMVGRGVRSAEGKAGCNLIDLCDNVRRFGRIETFEIIDQNGNEMWRLRSDRGNLTGVDVETGFDLEHIKGKIR